MALTSEQAERIGRMGGLATKKKMLAKDPDYYSRIGEKGGDAMLQKHGRDHFIRMGSMSPYKKDLLAAKREADGQA